MSGQLHGKNKQLARCGDRFNRLLDVVGIPSSNWMFVRSDPESPKILRSPRHSFMAFPTNVILPPSRTPPKSMIFRNRHYIIQYRSVYPSYSLIIEGALWLFTLNPAHHPKEHCRKTSRWGAQLAGLCRHAVATFWSNRHLGTKTECQGWTWGWNMM